MSTPNAATARHMLNKVPEVTLYFWLIKIMATTVGETAADYLNFNLHMGLAKTSVLMGGLLAVALAVQIASKRYIPAFYWVAVVFLSVFGTLITDNLSDNFGVALTTTTTIFSIALIATFASWSASERRFLSTPSSRRGASCSTGPPSSSPSRWVPQQATSLPKGYISATRPRPDL